MEAEEIREQGGAERYEGDKARRFGTEVRRAVKLQNEVKFNGRGEAKIQYERSVRGESD